MFIPNQNNYLEWKSPLKTENKSKQTCDLASHFKI